MPRTELNTLGEFGLIDRISQKNEIKHTATIKSIGDDAAVIDNQNYLTVVSTDLLMEGIHFDLAYTPLRHLGYKAVVVNLSDIYAMNAQPKHITVSLGLSNRVSVEAIDELYEGIYAACRFYNVDLIGGDTTSSLSGLVISITAIGQGIKEKLTYRNGAKKGDLLCVTGNLGAAYLGLQILVREKEIWKEHPDIQPDLEESTYLIECILKPEARRDMIDLFEKVQLVPTSMMDISDGLASELHHICKQSGVGAFIEETGVPIHPDAKLMALKFQLDPITCALSGGEDYELLFTVSPDDIEKIKYLPDVYIMGEITDAADGITLHTEAGKIHPITAQGWVHFQ
jgi:thiamine-monophosphate kinase